MPNQPTNPNPTGGNYTVEQIGQAFRSKYPNKIPAGFSDFIVGSKYISAQQTSNPNNPGLKMMAPGQLERVPQNIDQHISMLKNALAQQNNPPSTQNPNDNFLQDHPILKGVSDFLGTTGIGKGLTQSIFLNYTPEGQQLFKELQSGKITWDEFNQTIGGLVQKHQIAGSALQTGADILIPGEGGSMLSKVMKWGGIGALQGAGIALEKGQGLAGIAETAVGAAATNAVLPLAGKALGTVGKYIVGSKEGGGLPERLYAQFFKTTSQEFEKGVTTEGAKILQKTDPQAFQKAVDEGIIQMGKDGSIAVNKSAAEKALEAGVRGSPQKMAAVLVARNYSNELAIREAAKSAEPIAIRGWERNSLVKLLTQFRNRISESSAAGIFSKPLTDPLDHAITTLKNASDGRIGTSDALEIRRMLDAMQKARAYVKDANLSVAEGTLKNATNFLRRKINAVPGMGELMQKYSSNMSMLTDIVKRGAQIEGSKFLNLFDLMAVTEGSQVFGMGRESIGKGLTFDAVMRFLTSAVGGTYTASGLKAVGNLTESPFGQKALEVGGSTAALASSNLLKEIIGGITSTGAPQSNQSAQ